MTAIRPWTLACLLAFAMPIGRGEAADTWHTCAGFIDSVPATLTTQGVWCMNKDLSTAITSGAAITIASNNVILDCNGFKLGGLAAGAASATSGVHANARQNVAVRNCNIRGFRQGVNLHLGNGHLVEDNRIDNSLQMGINVSGPAIVRRNLVYDTGGPAASATGIWGTSSILDNTVSGLVGNSIRGIVGTTSGGVIRGNVVRGMAPAGGAGSVSGIYANAWPLVLVDNQVSATSALSGTGLSVSNSLCSDNSVTQLSTAYSGCTAGSGNTSLP